MARIAKLDCPHVDVRMYVSTEIEERFRIRACSKEPWTCAWIREMPPGSIFYDIGANVGPYSLMAAALGHTVVAIEPSFANYNRLCANILLNDLGDRVIPLCIALSDHGDACELMEQEPSPGYSGGAKRLRVPVLLLVDVPALFGLPLPTHIKLDTDGNEADVIQGAGPAESWMVEVQDGQQERIRKLLGEPTATFDTRDGQKIKGMRMCRYDAVKAEHS